MTEAEENELCDEFFATFENFVTEIYGERCPEVEGGCACCEMWALYDLANAMVCRP